MALKFGKEFVEAAAENKELAVNQRVMFKLGVKVPEPYLCVQYLKQIATKYNIDWDVNSSISNIAVRFADGIFFLYFLVYASGK